MQATRVIGPELALRAAWTSSGGIQSRRLPELASGGGFQRPDVSQHLDEQQIVGHEGRGACVREGIVEVQCRVPLRIGQHGVCVKSIRRLFVIG